MRVIGWTFILLIDVPIVDWIKFISLMNVPPAKAGTDRCAPKIFKFVIV
jgi:hypothetical protein